MVHGLEGFVGVLDLVYVLEGQGQEGLVGLEELGLVPDLEVLLLLTPVEVEGLAVEGQLLWSHRFMHCGQFWCRWYILCHFLV